MNRDIREIIEENDNRIRIIKAPYDPFRGTQGVVPRSPVFCKEMGGELLIPDDMLADHPEFASGISPEQMQEFVLVRFRYDFEYWAAYCARILTKESSEIAPFILRRAQVPVREPPPHEHLHRAVRIIGWRQVPLYAAKPNLFLCHVPFSFLANLLPRILFPIPFLEFGIKTRNPSHNG